ncbi:MAG: succinate dehydrogenase [Proteobacteria bacterium]|nr:succinate dehydrogenase [Pseudomonadota bacterium]
MSRKIRIYRFDPTQDQQGKYEDYPVPDRPNLSVMDALDTIYSNHDSSLGYYSHSRCNHGICSGCAVKINGRNQMACETPLPTEGEITIEPVSADSVVKDLVCKRAKSEGVVQEVKP